MARETSIKDFMAKIKCSGAWILAYVYFGSCQRGGTDALREGSAFYVHFVFKLSYVQAYQLFLEGKRFFDGDETREGQH